jgi:hypothetical protein
MQRGLDRLVLDHVGHGLNEPFSRFSSLCPLAVLIRKGLCGLIEVLIMSLQLEQVKRESKE